MTTIMPPCVKMRRNKNCDPSKDNVMLNENENENIDLFFRFYRYYKYKKYNKKLIIYLKNRSKSIRYFLIWIRTIEKVLDSVIFFHFNVNMAYIFHYNLIICLVFTWTNVYRILFTIHQINQNTAIIEIFIRLVLAD